MSAADAADRAAEGIRELNHITINPGGLTYPSDVYFVLANLQRAAAMLPQALDQIGRWLDLEHRAGRVRRDDGRDLTIDLGVVGANLTAAREHARRLAFVLDAAFNATAHLAYNGPIVDGDGGRS